MPIRDFSGNTFVAFTDISGFKDLMRDEKVGLEALRRFYQAGYEVLREQNGVEGFFVSDSGILFARTGNDTEKLKNILNAVKLINRRMLQRDYMLTTSIAYGEFDYHGRLEFDGIEKNPIYGNAYVKAFLDNERSQPRIQPGQCRIVLKNMPRNLSQDKEFSLLCSRGGDRKHLYYYWNLRNANEIEEFEYQYNDSYRLKYSGMLKALQHNR